MNGDPDPDSGDKHTNPIVSAVGDAPDISALEDAPSSASILPPEENVPLAIMWICAHHNGFSYADGCGFVGVYVCAMDVTCGRMKSIRVGTYPIYWIKESVLLHHKSIRGGGKAHSRFNVNLGTGKSVIDVKQISIWSRRFYLFSVFP